MNIKGKKIDFSNQELFIGIDVHKKSWTSYNTHTEYSIKDLFNASILKRVKETYGKILSTWKLSQRL